MAPCARPFHLVRSRARTMLHIFSSLLHAVPNVVSCTRPRALGNACVASVRAQVYVLGLERCPRHVHCWWCSVVGPCSFHSMSSVAGAGLQTAHGAAARTALHASAKSAACAGPACVHRSAQQMRPWRRRAEGQARGRRRRPVATPRCRSRGKVCACVHVAQHACAYEGGMCRCVLRSAQSISSRRPGVTLEACGASRVPVFARALMLPHDALFHSTFLCAHPFNSEVAGPLCLSACRSLSPYLARAHAYAHMQCPGLCAHPTDKQVRSTLNVESVCRSP